MAGLSYLLLLTVCVLFDFSIGKECTNIPTQLSSHTFRHELLSSNNQSWKEEMFSHYHLTPTDDSAWSDLLPRQTLKEKNEREWAMLYRKMKNTGGFRSPGNFLKEFSLHDVRLHPSSIHWRAQQTNLEYLLMLDVDSLVWSFRKTAGLPTPGKPYGGWEDPEVELRGHFVGHYLSASAKMWASTHNRSLEEKMSAVVSALSSCQVKIGTGYLSAFPSEQFDRFEAIKPVWAPYYTIHKILAGLLDQYIFAGNAQALNMATWMVEYFYKRVQKVILKYTIERHWLSLNEETGGMNDVLYKLYSITADDISGFHANTHIPIVIGSQMRYEITNDPLYKTMAAYFMDIVNSSHSYATGGTSVSEFWTDPKRLASTLYTENEESCTTYNMLKVSRCLFTWTKEMAYADYYERALTNGVLSIQRGTEPGVMIYMLPLIPGGSKAKSYHGWGTQFDSFWCCYGTGIESFSKLGDSIYFEEQEKVPGLYVIQYISSSLNWKAGNVLVEQRVDPISSSDSNLRVTFTFSPKSLPDQLSTLNFRIPIWTYSDGAKAYLNAQSLDLPAPGNFLSVTRRWSSSDKLTLLLPMALRREAIKDDRPEYASIEAILYGPYLLAGLTHGDWEIKSAAASSLSDWISPIPAAYNSQLVSFVQESEGSNYVLINSNQSIRMEKYPDGGTDSTVHATFRLDLKEPTSSKFSSTKDIVGESVMLEPIAFPGMFITHRGTDQNLLVQESETGGASVFHLVPGLDGRPETVSLESDGHKGCFISSGMDYHVGASTKLACISGSSDPHIKQATSFMLKSGISSYHPISFRLKGHGRNFLLAPLLSLRDESYTVYFNFQA